MAEIRGDFADRWLNDPQVFNRYAYSRNNPLGYVNPSGHGWFTVFLAVAAVSLFVASVFCPVTAVATVKILLILSACVTAAGLFSAIYESVKVDIKELPGGLGVLEEIEGKNFGGWTKDTEE